MKKKILILGIVIVVSLITGYFLWQISTPLPKELELSDFPEVFKENTVIVIGENATQIEKESAEAIAANLKNLTGNKPDIISSKEIESFKHSYNLIVVGTPNSNKVLEEVYNITNATRVTEEYPGQNKGILEILRNPWNEEKAMLLVEGSDEWGVKAGVAKLNQRRELNKTIEKAMYRSGFIQQTEFVPELPPVPEAFDKNTNRIDDSLDKQIIDEKKTGTDQIAPIIVMLRQPCNKTQLNLFKKMGGEIEYVYDAAFYGFAGSLSLSKIPEFADYLGDSLYFISPDKKVELNYNKNHKK